MGAEVVSAISKDRAQLRVNAAGLVSENYSRGVASTQTALTSQTLYACLVGLRAGDIVTNVCYFVGVLASGTTPTLLKGGLCDKTGKVLKLTGNLAADSMFTTVGTKQMPLTAAYTIPADDAYYVCILQNGAFGSANPQFARTNGSGAIDAVGAGVREFAGWASQSDFPAVDASVTITGTANIALWSGVS